MPSSALKLEHPGLARLYRYWNERRGDALMPSRADIDPMDMKELLKNLFLADVEGDPPRFRYRLVGTELEATIGRKLTGYYVDAGVLGGLTEVAQADMVKMVQEPQVIYRSGVLLISEEPFFNYVRLAVPLGTKDGQVQIILGAIFYTWISERNRSAEEAKSEALRITGKADQRWVGEFRSVRL